MEPLTREEAIESVGMGWSAIVGNLYDIMPNGVEVIQVKEKFGGLRFYVDGAPEWFYDDIDKAEELSFITCEECGEAGTTRESSFYWLVTLCDKHYEEREAWYKEKGLYR